MLHRTQTASARHPVLRPTSLEEFCRAAGASLAGVSEAEAPQAAASLLPGLLANPALLGDDQRTAPPAGYGRHCIFACPRDTYSVLAMVWPPGFTSPIHDHKTWCAFGVYEGVLGERRFVPASAAAGETRAVPNGTMTHRPGAVAYLPPDAPDIHSMHNPTDQPTISIHVYGGNATALGPNVNRIWTART